MERGPELRCYLRDPDSYLMTVGAEMEPHALDAHRAKKGRRVIGSRLDDKRSTPARGR